MTRLPASQAREDFADTLNRVAFGKERVILNRHGKDLAALISIEDLELLRELEDRYDNELADRALAESSGTVPWEDVKRNLGL